MEMGSDGTRNKPEGGIGKWAVDILRVPTVVGGSIGDRKSLLDRFWKIVTDDRDAVSAERLAGLPDPSVTPRIPWSSPIEGRCNPSPRGLLSPP